MDLFQSIIDGIIIVVTKQSIDNEAVQNAFMLFTCHIRCVPAMDCWVALLSPVPVCIVQRSKLPWRLKVVIFGGKF